MKSIYEFLLKSKTDISTQDMGYVDLGLPSGILWATCNIGAEKPTDYGDYFMWGSTEPDTDKLCDWDTAPFNDGHKTFNKEYFESVKNKVCPNDILAPEYDAASIIIGNGWRLPTKEDVDELIDNTKRKWINNYKDSKINGMLFQANGAEIFIPAAGYRTVSSFSKQGSGSVAVLWCSTLYNILSAYAHVLYFDESTCYTNTFVHRCGFCLRAVKE